MEERNTLHIYTHYPLSDRMVNYQAKPNIHLPTYKLNHSSFLVQFHQPKLLRPFHKAKAWPTQPRVGYSGKERRRERSRGAINSLPLLKTFRFASLVLQNIPFGSSIVIDSLFYCCFCYYPPTPSHPMLQSNKEGSHQVTRPQTLCPKFGLRINRGNLLYLYLFSGGPWEREQQHLCTHRRHRPLLMINEIIPWIQYKGVGGYVGD